ncbi:hypothetical protein SLEP1_g27853 [Rubroshorea leprosula]|uniref:Uncharacterized protein n=1 Tax=Rubroshorea leprosula TaxID=152421 RepID=A0AAV5JUF5_9ROSI|nr:hypothetical protein SLEP1_g27853 [Rubroshorea leprosula]
MGPANKASASCSGGAELVVSRRKMGRWTCVEAVCLVPRLLVAVGLCLPWCCCNCFETFLEGRFRLPKR